MAASGFALEFVPTCTACLLHAHVWRISETSFTYLRLQPWLFKTSAMYRCVPDDAIRLGRALLTMSAHGEGERAHVKPAAANVVDGRQLQRPGAQPRNDARQVGVRVLPAEEAGADPGKGTSCRGSIGCMVQAQSSSLPGSSAAPVEELRSDSFDQTTSDSTQRQRGGSRWAGGCTHEGPPVDWSMAMYASSHAPCAVMIHTVMCPIHLDGRSKDGPRLPFRNLRDGQVEQQDEMASAHDMQAEALLCRYCMCMGHRPVVLDLWAPSRKGQEVSVRQQKL